MNSEKLAWLAIGVFFAYVLFSKGATMVQNAGGLVEKMADAIQKFEGWFNGSLSQRNNNPGNIKYFGGPKWQGQVGVDNRQFVIFDSYENGRRALIISLRNAATGKSGVYNPDMSFTEFFRVYAPSADNNHPEAYAKFVADQLDVSVNDPISVIV